MPTENTQVVAPDASNGEVDPLRESRLRVAEKRALLEQGRQAREEYQKKMDVVASEARLEAEERALDRELAYEAEAARILLANEPKRNEDGSLVPPDQTGIAVGEVEDGEFVGSDFVAPAVVPEELRDPTLGAINLPPEEVKTEVKVPETETATAEDTSDTPTVNPLLDEQPTATGEVDTPDENQE